MVTLLMDFQLIPTRSRSGSWQIYPFIDDFRFRNLQFLRASRINM